MGSALGLVGPVSVYCDCVRAIHTPGVMGSALGLVGPVSVYCDWVRKKV